MIDKELVTRKINLVAADLEKIIALARKGEEEYLADPLDCCLLMKLGAVAFFVLEISAVALIRGRK